ncbi:MAG: hypothetical protein WA117_23910 [Verrucomicrobiia bacterium]
MKDEEQLKLLSVFHYVVGGLAGLFALFPVLHLIVGLFLVFAPVKFDDNGGWSPATVGRLIVIGAATITILGCVFAAFVLTAGRFIAKRKHYMFCFVVGAVECVFLPFGTVLGVFTIIVLMRESVKNLFAANNSVASTSGSAGASC